MMTNPGETSLNQPSSQEVLQSDKFAFHIVLLDHVGNTIPMQLQQAFNACDVFIPEDLNRGPQDEISLQQIANAPTFASAAPIRFHFVRKLAEMIAGSKKTIKLIDPIGGPNPFDAFKQDARKIVTNLAQMANLTPKGIEAMMKSYNNSVTTLAQSQSQRENGMVENLLKVLSNLQTTEQKQPLQITFMLGRHHEGFIDKIHHHPILQKIHLSAELVQEDQELVETPFAQLLKLHKENTFDTLSLEEQKLLIAQGFLQAVIEHSSLNWADSARIDKDRSYFLKNLKLLNTVCRSFTGEQILQMLSATSSQQRIKQVGSALQVLLNTPGTPTHQMYADLLAK